MTERFRFGPTMGELMLQAAIKRERNARIRAVIYTICAVALTGAALKFIFG